MTPIAHYQSRIALVRHVKAVQTAPMTPQWRQMDDAARAVAYSPSSMLDGPLDPYIEAYIRKSRAAYDALPDVQTLVYGPKESNSVDIVTPAGQGPWPLHVFIHGGYWQELSKRESFFPAPGTLARGMAYAAVDYTLAPAATLDDIVEECRAAIRCLRRQAGDLGIDADRLVISGSSAGAHLAAMCGATLPQAERPTGLVLLSGVYELEALIGTYINDAVGMDAAAARRNSPGLLDLSGFPPSVVTWGEAETDEFKRQSRHFAGLIGQAGGAADCFEVAGRNHFDIVDDLVGDTPLGNKLAMLSEAQGDHHA